MAFAPPVLVAQIALRSPQIRSLPLGLQRAIQESGDVAGPGRYVVTGTHGTGVNIRQSASVSAKAIGLAKEGASGTTDGTVDNGFAYVTWDNGDEGWSSVLYLAPEASGGIVSGGGGAPQSAPVGPEIPAGAYVVTTAVDDLNLRSQPVIAQGNVLATIPKGAVVQATGENQNYFAKVIYNGVTGWASTSFLTAQGGVQQGGSGGVLILSAADTLQLRTLLAAWANATPNVPQYGSPANFLMNEDASRAQEDEVYAFQKWNNATKGTSLRTDGVVDQATRAAITNWATNAAGAPVPSPAGLPPITPANPIATDPLSPEQVSVDQTPSSGSSLPLGALGALAIGLFFVLEEKKKRKK